MFDHIDTEKIKSQIAEAKELKDSKELFETLALLTSTGKEIKDALEEFAGLEREIKQAINDRAKSLYGDKWSAIAGEKYKVSRSFTGNVYDISDEVDKKFVVVKKSANTKEIDNYIKEKGQLPKGVDLNSQRGEMLRITVRQ